MKILFILSIAIIIFLAETFQASAAEPLTLEQAWVQAYQNNPSLEAARAKLRATDEQVSQALSHWRPSVNATANIGKTYQYTPSQEEFGTADFADTTRGYGVQVTQPIFRGFRTLSEIEAAKKQVLGGRAQLQDTEQQLLLDTATAFLDSYRDEAILQIDHDNEYVLSQKLEETKIRARIGDLTQTDVQQAESRLARAETNRLQTENALAKDHDALMRLTGTDIGSLQKPDITSEQQANLDEILNHAETQNPNVLAAQYAVEQADAEIDLNKSSLLPELDLVGSSSRNHGQSSTLPGRFDSTQIMLQLTVPLYDGGADYSKSREAEQVLTQRRMELEEARHRAHESANNAWQALRVSEATVKADNREVDATARALDGVKIQSKVGTRTTLDVLNAQQELLDAKTELARTEHDEILATLQIKAATGALTADALKLPLDTYDPKRHYDDIRDAWIGFGDSDNDVYRLNPNKAVAE